MSPVLIAKPQVGHAPAARGGATVPPLPRPPRASIVIVSYNGWYDLQRCLQSLQDAGHHDDEIIVVDNASNDGSTSLVIRDFPGVRLVTNGTNTGFGHGNNVGAQHATGTFLAFLNPDTTVEAGWLDHLIAALEADPQAALATPKILLMDEPDRINACGNDVHLTGLTLCRGVSRSRWELATAGEVPAISGAAFAMRRDLFHSLGGFDEEFFLYMEDTELSWRARLAGHRCLYVPESIVYHDYALRFGSRKTYYQERNRYLMLLKSLHWRTLLVLLPAFLLAEAITWSFSLFMDRRNWTNKLHAYAYVWRNWRGIMAQRMQVQALRRATDRALLEVTQARMEYEQAARGSLAARLATLVFDPLFTAYRRLALSVVQW